MNTGKKLEVYLVWDHSRQEHGEAPEHMAVFATEDDAIAYGKEAFESNVWAECLIEHWIAGADRPEREFTLAETQE